MGYRPRKGSSGRSKLHAVKQHRTSKNHAGLSPCIHRCVGGEGLRRVRKYIMKALDFGVESGYLIPTDRSYRMLRVSSDLLRSKRKTTSKTTRYKSNTDDSRRSRERNNEDEDLDDEIRSITRFEDYPVQDAPRRRRSRRKRSRSRSRRRRKSRRSSKRRRSSENPEEAGEDDDDDDYEIDENAGKKSSRTEHTSNESKSARSKTQDTGKTNVQTTDDISDVSVDEDDTDEEEDKKEANISKS